MPSGSLSNLNTAFYYGIRRAIRERQGLARGSLEGLLRQGRLLFVNSRFRCFPSILTLRAVHSLVGATPQSHFVPAVSSSDCQAFDYISDSSNRRNMAASGSKAAAGDLMVDNFLSSCGNVASLAKPLGVYFGDRNTQSCRKASIRMRIREPNNSCLARGYFIFDVSRRFCNSNRSIGGWMKNIHNLTALCYSDQAVPDTALDGLACDNQLAGLTITADQNLKLLSGSCYLPHPDKEETGGEDAHFLCVNEQAFGVADGVGGWADVGVNAGEYARQLMSNSVLAIQDEPKGSIDPARVLEKAHSSTKAMGSSTACIITLRNQQDIHAINLGDSGFIMVRDGCTIFQSPVQQHAFNFTFQLENSIRGDQPSSGQVFTIPVAAGDVIVAGTDGLFDNLYNNEITAIVAHALGAGFGPEVMAQKIAALARQRAQDRNRQTPFSTAAQEAGFPYYGGKLDDITVVASYITSSADT